MSKPVAVPPPAKTISTVTICGVVATVDTTLGSANAMHLMLILN